MLIEAGSKLVMIGDSITDCGRACPVGEGPREGLGNGYVGIVHAVLATVRPDLGIRVVNTGIGGNTVRDLKARWQSDVVDLKPDWLSIMIGINDVWRQFDSPALTEKHVLIDEYKTTLDELVMQTKPSLKGLVLMTPYFIEPNTSDPMRAGMDEYAEVVKETARKHNALCVDTQAAFDKVCEHLHPMSIAWDRVHPSLTGHFILARAFLNAIGFQW